MTDSKERIQLDLWELRKTRSKQLGQPEESNERRVRAAQGPRGRKTKGPSPEAGPRKPAAEVFSVSQIIRRAVRALEGEFGTIWVEGEISNFRKSPAGHLYFSLRDERSQLSAIMFRSAARGLRHPVSDGRQVRCRGRISIYPAQGKFQIIVDSMEPAGLGELLAAVERLKKKLAGEGLFDPDRKRALPSHPMVVGVVTSPRGAALRDIINVVSRRWPARLVVSPAVVQGAAAAESLVAALQQIQLHPSVEVVICGRGGGSMEDLAAFNDERVVRAIASCRVPIISAVGHEIDVSLSDLAADRRAPTPSAAAELAVPDRREICKAIEGLSGTLRHFLIGRLRKEHLELVRLRGRLGDPTRRLAVARQDVDALWQRLARATRLRVRGEMCRCDELIDRLHSVHPKARLKRRRQRLVELSFRLADAQRGCLDRARRRLTEARMDIRASAMRWLAPRRRRLEATSGKLGGLDPLSVLDRGYSLVTDESGAPLHDARRVSRGDAVSVRMSRGGLACRVEEVFAGENGSGEERRPCESKRKT